MIAGGGTAGHLMPGISVADSLVSSGTDPSSLLFVGSEHGIDRSLLERTAYESTYLPGRGIQRRITPSNVVASAGLAVALVRSLILLARRRPKVVLALGGYASISCSVAAVLLRIPLVVAEQNARSGLANRVVARFARACAVSFADTDLPKAVHTGNPIRQALLTIRRPQDSASSRAALGLPQDRRVIAVFSGSLGSRRINLAMREAVERLGDRGDIAVHHVIGSRDWEELSACSDNQGTRKIFYQAVRYEDRMGELLAAADLVVSRAGGSTVAELTAIGVPAILVPLPIATRDHQTANARSLVDAGAAVLLQDSALDGELLATTIAEIVDSPARLARMEAAALSLGRPDAADRVALLMREYAR